MTHSSVSPSPARYSKREQMLAVAHRHGARNLRIYGSVARGQDRPGSDLDFLVDLERGCFLLEVIALWLTVRSLIEWPMND